VVQGAQAPSSKPLPAGTLAQQTALLRRVLGTQVLVEAGGISYSGRQLMLM